MKKKIIITGGLGFIGSSLISKLLPEYRIIILDNSKKRKKIPKNVEIINCDLTNPKSLNKIKVKNINCLVHLAGQSSGPKSFHIPEEDLRLNLLSTINIVNFCKLKRINKIVFSSTFTVYGDTDRARINEREKCSPKSFYGLSKFASENYLIKLTEKYKLKWNILRFFNVYGPGQDLSRKDQGIVSIFLDLIRNNTVIKVNGSLKRYRDLIYIDDVVDALILIIKDNKNYNQIYNVGTGKKTTIKKLLQMISKVYDKENTIKIKVLNSTPGDILGCYADLTKIKKDLKFYPKVNLFDGLNRFKNWAEKNFYIKN